MGFNSGFRGLKKERKKFFYSFVTKKTLEALYKMVRWRGRAERKGENPKIGHIERGERPPHHKPQSSQLFSLLNLIPRSHDM